MKSCGIFQSKTQLHYINIIKNSVEDTKYLPNKTYNSTLRKGKLTCKKRQAKYVIQWWIIFVA